MAAIHQFVAGFNHGDAISNEAVAMRRVFQSWGYESDILSETRHTLPELRRQISDVADYAAVCGPEDIVLLHLSIGSAVNHVFRALDCRKAILYHNVTPSRYFDLINKRTAMDLANGRNQLKELAGVAEVNMADSRFNAIELEALGYSDVKVLPLILDLDRLTSSSDRKAIRKFDDGTVNVLFVGRCAPNKKIEDVITAFFYFQRFVEPNSRLIHVGSYAGAERYYYLLLAQVRELHLQSVHFAGIVPQPVLNAYYECSDIFLCMSEHEGFCIPLLESMVHNVPVMAFSAGAIPETMAGAGILFHEKRLEAIAEMMGRLSSDATLRSAVLKGQQSRLDQYRDRDLAAELRQHLSPLLSKV